LPSKRNFTPDIEQFISSEYSYSQLPLVLSSSPPDAVLPSRLRLSFGRAGISWEDCKQ